MILLTGTEMRIFFNCTPWANPECRFVIAPTLFKSKTHTQQHPSVGATCYIHGINDDPKVKEDLVTIGGSAPPVRPIAE